MLKKFSNYPFVMIVDETVMMIVIVYYDNNLSTTIIYFIYYYNILQTNIIIAQSTTITVKQFEKFSKTCRICRWKTLILQGDDENIEVNQLLYYYLWASSIGKH